MPATTTQTKTKTRNSTKTKVEPDTQTEVSIGLQRAIDAYVKADGCVQSKLWPLVDEALDLFEEPMSYDDARGQFYMAFALRHRTSPNDFTKNEEYQRFRMMVYHVFNVAKLGRHTIKQLRDAGHGFWKIEKQANDKTKDAPCEDEDLKSAMGGKAKPGPKAKQAKEPPPPGPSNKRNGSKAEAEAEPEAKSGNVKVPKATPEWRERFRHIIQHEAEAFVEELEFCVNRGWLPDGEWLETIKSYLAGE